MFRIKATHSARHNVQIEICIIFARFEDADDNDDGKAGHYFFLYYRWPLLRVMTGNDRGKADPSNFSRDS